MFLLSLHILIWIKKNNHQQNLCLNFYQILIVFKKKRVNLLILNYNKIMIKSNLQVLHYFKKIIKNKKMVDVYNIIFYKCQVIVVQLIHLVQMFITLHHLVVIIIFHLIITLMIYRLYQKKRREKKKNKKRKKKNKKNHKL